jgi:uncharacterized protein (TIGR01777 family)
MRVLVTGASGMIGSAVCDALLARGDEVVGLSRDPVRASRSNPTVHWHQWTATSERPPVQALDGADAVVNMVGEAINQRLTDAAKARILATRERATKNLVDAIAAASTPPRVLVSQSAVGRYGDRGETIVDESTPAGDDFLAGVCVRWEAAAAPAADAGVRLAITRTGHVLDPSGGLLKQLLIPFKLGVGGPLAGGGWYMPWIHRDDVVGLVLWALDRPEAAGAFNSCAPNPVTNRDFSTALGRALRRPAIAPVPRLAVAAILGGEMATAATSSIRAVPRRALDDGYRFRFAEVEPALRDLLART